jgi:hypothetical protein
VTDKKLFKRLPRLPRRKILEYIDSPSFALWVIVRAMVVAPGLSLWDAMDTLDRNWEGMYPPAILVARASMVIDQRHEDLGALVM